MSHHSPVDGRIEEQRWIAAASRAVFDAWTRRYVVEQQSDRSHKAERQVHEMAPHECALEEIRTARRYVLQLLDNVPDDRWFDMPGGVSHVAWQAGHLAIAQWRLTLERIRGPRPIDSELLIPDMARLFGKGSVPQPDAGQYPAPAEIRVVMQRVYEQVERESADWVPAALDVPTTQPHPWFTTKLGALFWCSRHEMLHAGQIGLIRRQLGETALW